ncbi:MAG: 4-alpha-glucanotransferase [Clostridia bacterium]|nr:4-alpha-glucanotransferase [Clostridia bacterium]
MQLKTRLEKKDKKCGILMPVSSLPSKYGIGSFGKWAYRFVDFLKEAGQTYWQMLPLVMTGYGDSPYQTVCDVSGNPYFIDLETLRDEGLLTYREVEKAIDKGDKIDYERLYRERFPLLRKAFSRFDVKDRKFKDFLKEKKFDDFAVFMALSQKFGSEWINWPNEFKFYNKEAIERSKTDNQDEYLFWQFVQYKFWSQYSSLKKYANNKGISILGDLPLYVSYNSVDVWSDPKQFLLDENFKPKKVAGVPPDYFSEDGQLWGNPVYDYDQMRADGFSYWKKRLSNARSVYDLVRIDHFRGLDRFWAVPADSDTAKVGEWMAAPGREIFSIVGTERIIAEDLGVLDEGVYGLIKDLSLPGMKVLSFAFEGDDKNDYLPWNVTEISFCYTGTHDIDTLIGYLKSLNGETLKKVKKMVERSLDYLGLYKSTSGLNAMCDAIIEIAFACKSKLAILPLQDHLHLGSEYRINTPGSVGWWKVRIKESVLTENLAKKIRLLAVRHGR